MFLEILGALERLAAKFALVRLQGNVDTDVGSDVVALDGGSATATPLTLKVEVVGALAADMTFTDVVLQVECQLDVFRMMCCRNEVRRHRDSVGFLWARQQLSLPTLLGLEPRQSQSQFFTYIESFWCFASFSAVLPLAGQAVDRRRATAIRVAIASVGHVAGRRWQRGYSRRLLMLT